MSGQFDPSLFAVAKLHGQDPNADWMAQAERLPVTTHRSPKGETLYIPAIPRTFLRAAAAAGDALELLLVALAEMRMRATTEIAIGPALWKQAGNPSKHVRVRLLSQLGTLPPSLCTLVPRRGRPHLLVTGPDWPRQARR